MVEELTPDDEPTLLALYGQQSSLTNKRALTWGLAAVGGDASAEAIIRTLLEDYENREVTLREWEVLRDSMEALGLLAVHSDVAHAFLVEALSEEFWAGHRKWQDEKEVEEAFSDRRFAGLALQAWGASNRPGLSGELSARAAQEGDRVADLAGPITTAAFYRDITESEGTKKLLHYHITKQLQNKYFEWCRDTENGQRWWAWGTNALLSSQALTQ